MDCTRRKPHKACLTYDSGSARAHGAHRAVRNRRVPRFVSTSLEYGQTNSARACPNCFLPQNTPLHRIISIGTVARARCACRVVVSQIVRSVASPLTRPQALATYVAKPERRALERGLAQHAVML